MSNEKIKLSIPRLIFIVAGTIGMFAAAFFWGNYVHYPVLGRLCAASCERSGLRLADVEPGYVATSINEDCVCGKDDGAGGLTLSAGTFFVSIGALDWFLTVLFRLLPLAVILFLFVLVIAKVVVRL